MYPSNRVPICVYICLTFEIKCLKGKKCKGLFTMLLYSPAEYSKNFKSKIKNF